MKVFVGIAYIALLVLFATSIIKNLSETLRIIYFKNSPVLFITLFFIISSIVCNKFPLKVLAKANLIISPIVFAAVMIILVSSIKNFMPQQIFPILGYGVDRTFLSGLSNIFSFSGMLYLLFLPPLLDKPDKLKRLSIVAVIISSLYLLLSVTCLLLSLSFSLSSDESFSLYVLTRSLEYGRFVQRVDAIFILVWIISIISYINIPIFFCINILKKITNIHRTTSVNFAINLLILVIAILPIEYAFFTNVLGKVLQYSFLVLFFGISIPILICANFKPKLKKVVPLTCILLVNLVFLSGCYDARGIEDLAYVTALGLDISDNNVLSLTFQISIPGSSSESGSSQSSKTENTTVQCSSIDNGISLVNSYISKQINLSHCKAIVFSEKIAAGGIGAYIETLSNNVEIRPDCNVIISRCTAKDFIENATPSIETLTARYYEVAIKSSEYTGYTTSTEFATFINDVQNSFIQGSAILGGINTGNNSVDEALYVGIDGSYKANESPIDDVNNVETFGTAVFHDDKLVGELSGFETICLLLISNKIQSCTISVPSPFKYADEIDLFIREDKTPKIRVDMVNGTPHIFVDLFLEAHGLTLNDSVDYTSLGDVELLERSSEQFVEMQVSNFLYKTAKEFNSDVVGFGKYALNKYLTWDEWEDANWNENYRNSFFSVSVHVSVLSGGQFDKVSASWKW